ncbi:PIR Superfamily Protein [Plasmodium ovale curtisi]|uniref:PIR Superfamily Protein n=1 Tax=Plasmodium ovale curtisi TaxID=864141 RepID=A0A1A8XCZ2_PLAOA|nr:PIR Superfamily Protein [Plasmodium ovale curtisi]
MGGGEFHGETGVILGNSSLELHTQKFYEELNSESIDLSRYSLHCNNIYVNNNKEEVKKICEKFLRNLEKSLVWKVESPSYDYCILLNYWIYDKLTNIFGDKNASDNINIAFSNFQYIWKYTINDPKITSYYKNCEPKFDMVNNHDWKNRKKLLEYCVDYDILLGLAKNYDEKCDYYKKLEEKMSLYEHFEKECSDDKNNCPEFYNKCEGYNPENVLSTLNCHNPIKAQREDESGGHVHDTLQTERPGQEQGFRSPVHGPGVPELADISDTGLTSENSQIGKKIGHGVLGVAPVLLTASALYRYTPIGSWVRKLSGYSPNGISDMDRGDIDGFLSHTEESENMLFHDTSNYISYQPM